MRRFFFCLVTVFLCCLFCVPSFADAVLYRGNANAGSVRSVVKDSVLCVCLEDAGRLLGFMSSVRNDELTLTRGNVSVRVSEGATAGWQGFSIVPLYSAPFQKDGNFWLDSRSTAALFQRFFGKSESNRIRFAVFEDSAASVTNARDFGEFEEPEPKPKPIVAQANIDSIISASSVQQDTKSQEEKWEELKASLQAESTKAESTKKEEPSAVPPKPVEKPKPAKSQPRLETFKPDDTLEEKADGYSGTIQGVRWTLQEGNNKKVRAVIMTDEGADPQVFMNKGELHALFTSSLENSAGIASPFAENVKAEIRKNSDGIELVFTPKGITKAEKIVLNNPRRIMFDFFFPENTNIIGTAVKTPDIQLPGQVSKTQPVTPKTQEKPSAKPDPVITADPNPYPSRPAPVMTPPSTITIPTTPQRPRGRKTIVIDPGHGGKDPGAMDNGVKEKDVNLAVGLELQKALNARGYNALMTRANDVYLKLQERTDIANNVKADLFVSVHVNALPNKKSMTGFEIYIMALPTDKDAMNLAKIENREYVEGKGMDTANVDKRTEMLLHILGDMQQNNKISESTDFAAALYNSGVMNNLPMRRVAQAPFFVLRGAGMPAVLLEIGFVTNAEESKLLTTQAYQQRIAKAMSEGIANYIK